MHLRVCQCSPTGEKSATMHGSINTCACTSTEAGEMLAYVAAAAAGNPKVEQVSERAELRRTARRLRVESAAATSGHTMSADLSDIGQGIIRGERRLNFLDGLPLVVMVGVKVSANESSLYVTNKTCSATNVGQASISHAAHQLGQPGGASADRAELPLGRAGACRGVGGDVAQARGRHEAA